MDPIAHICDLPQYDHDGRDLIRRAFARASDAHRNQKRADGSPYIVHPTAVAVYLADLGFDAASVAAAFLHDVVEDCGVTRDELEREFGRDVAFLVDGVTKLKSIRLHGANRDKKESDLQTESLKKMFFAMAEDLRVIMIKLADRLHNMRTLEYKEPAARTRKALETMEIYAPIADRLGMGRMKGELEDLSFPYAYPTEYAWLKRTVRDRYEDRLKYIERAAPVVRQHLIAAGITVVDIHARAKRMWSLYRKLKRYGMDPDKVLDLVAMRIILPDVKSCYEALGAIHAHYKPMPGRVKDFIALPKPNGYRSLHTSVFCEKGRIAEIQLRTPGMHDHAENGVAAHWAYAEQGKHKNTSAKASELAWINQLKATLKDIKTSAGMANLKVDFFKNRIFALTPNGDVKDLPEGATPVDFAYAVHSELGHRTQGALVNGKLVSLTYRLQSGDVVDIQKVKDERPSKNWLRFVRTTHAAKHIRSWFKQHEAPVEPLPVAVTAAVRRSRPAKGTGVPVRVAKSGILIAGHTGLAYKLGKCCSPAIDSPIVGYLTVSRGVTIHRIGCSNIKTAPEERLMDSRWV
ncbi:MAG TPA: RelA/SpoT family protein [Candidatus Paceibacterota bacterium]|nr:RelA/SpoT family protein [Candidatus Paceibacterota bacterium]